MNCVYTAYKAHMKHLGLDTDEDDFEVYLYAKDIVDDRSRPTYGGVVPWIISVLAGGSGCAVTVQHRLVTPAHYLADPDMDMMHRIIVGISDFGEEVEELTLAPAIYLDLTAQHASFQTQVPKGVLTMALQITEV